MGEDEFLATIHTPKRGGVLLDTPRASGFAVLELSNVHMLKVHYDYYKKTYGDKARLVFTDTDSLCYEIQTRDPIVDMVNAEWPDFDIIGALTPHKMAELCGGDQAKIEGRFLANKGKLGAMKLETKQFIMAVFIGLASKLYRFQVR